MGCEYLSENNCKLAELHVDGVVQVPVTESACNYCSSCDNPKSLNKAVASIAVSELIKSGKFNSKNPKHSEIQAVLTVDPSGVGTELKKLISWFPIPKKTGCRSCRSLEIKMNNWGPEKCEKKIDYIIKKLRVAAVRRSLPFSESLAKTLIRRAIRNAK
jgi:hypothetical protein